LQGGGLESLTYREKHCVEKNGRSSRNWEKESKTGREPRERLVHGETSMSGGTHGWGGEKGTPLLVSKGERGKGTRYVDIRGSMKRRDQGGGSRGKGPKLQKWGEGG